MTSGSPGPTRHERLRRLVSGRAERRGRTGWSGLVCDVVSERLVVDGAAIAVHTDGIAVQELVAVAGEWARHLEEMQYTVGDGPAIEATETGSPVLITDLAGTDGRWPGFAQVADEAGLGAAFVFPLRAGPAPIGTLDLFRRGPRPLSPDELAEAAALADIATEAVLADVGTAGAVPAPWLWADVPGHYDQVNIASGLLAGELRISVEEARVRLRADAFLHGVPVNDVARSVVRLEVPASTFAD